MRECPRIALKTETQADKGTCLVLLAWLRRVKIATGEERGDRIGFFARRACTRGIPDRFWWAQQYGGALVAVGFLFWTAIEFIDAYPSFVLQGRCQQSSCVVRVGVRIGVWFLRVLR